MYKNVDEQVLLDLEKKGNLLSAREQQLSDEDTAITSNLQLATFAMNIQQDVRVKQNNSIEESVLEKNRAVVEDEDMDFLILMQQGKNALAVAGMASIEGITGSCLRAMIKEDKNGKKTVVFAQQYQDGTFSPTVEVEQSRLIQYVLYRIQESNLGTVSKEDISKFKDAQFKRDNLAAVRFYNKLEEVYYATMSREPLEIDRVIIDLFKALGALPVLPDRAGQMLTSGECYWKLLELIKHGSSVGVCLLPYKGNENEDFYLLTTYDMESYANNFCEQGFVISSLELIKKLNDGGFLFVQGSAGGYQSNVRYNDVFNDGKPSIDKFYCLRKMENLKRLIKGVQQN